LSRPRFPVNADIHLAHTLGDTVALAALADIEVCIDLQACWFESDLERRLAEAVPRCGLVQVSDYVYGDRSAPCRAVPGDGVIPLTRFLDSILSAGYTGVFDLELCGPRIEHEGPASATARAAENLSTILEDIGA
jgi:sugar phosphate isomerase/epimerase